MEVAKQFFNFFHEQLEQRSTILCNVYGGTEMMDNICDIFQNWDEVVSPLISQLGLILFYESCL